MLTRGTGCAILPLKEETKRYGENEQAGGGEKKDGGNASIHTRAGCGGERKAGTSTADHAGGRGADLSEGCRSERFPGVAGDVGTGIKPVEAS